MTIILVRIIYTYFQYLFSIATHFRSVNYVKFSQTNVTDQLQCRKVVLEAESHNGLQCLTVIIIIIIIIIFQWLDSPLGA
jgi:uncharacterized membrane protein